jgi:hypothetical protein
MKVVRIIFILLISLNLRVYGLSVIDVIGNAYDIGKGEKIIPETNYEKPITISVNKRSRIMLREKDSSLFLHIGSDSLIELQTHQIFIDRGVFLIGSSDQEFSMKVKSFSSSTDISGTGFMLIERTKNDGLKLIGLSGKIIIRLESKNETMLDPGQVHFLYPNIKKFGTSVNIDLLKLCESSLLITGFNESISDHLNDLKRSSIQQRSKIKTRYNAIVGGMKNEDSFEVVVIETDKD